jgi:hypothetical protein
MNTAHPGLDEIADDEFGADASAAEYRERDGHARRWVRYVMPVMVEVDCEDDEIISVVRLPSEIRLDRDDVMELCICDEAFRRTHADEQQAAHALYIADPEWQHPTVRCGGPVNWPATTGWHEDYFPRDADDDAYSEVHPYGDDDQEY